MRAPKAHNKITGIFNQLPPLRQCRDTVAIDSHKHRPDESSHALESSVLTQRSAGHCLNALEPSVLTQRSAGHCLNALVHVK